MTESTGEIRAGDWVRIKDLWPGIWRVYRVLGGFLEHQWSLDQPAEPANKVLIFCHRLVNDSWKRSFSHNSCNTTWAKLVSPEERNSVESLMASNASLQKAFEKYQSKNSSLDSVTNIGFGALTQELAANFRFLCDRMLADRISGGMTLREILLLSREHGLESFRGRMPQQVTLQLTNINYEMRD